MGIMARVSSLCVYCGSSSAVAPEFLSCARDFGRTLGQARIEVIYGGGRVGMMGQLADGALEAGGTVTGIIPHGLHAREVAHLGLTNLILVDTMHQRKQLMAERADAFVVLPGGFGTLDEMFEILTWRILGLHDKPIVLVNQQGYWDPLLALMERIFTEGFAAAATRRQYLIVGSVAAVLPALAVLPQSHPAVEIARI